jgi:hypothetical protein
VGISVKPSFGRRILGLDFVPAAAMWANGACTIVQVSGPGSVVFL